MGAYFKFPADVLVFSIQPPSTAILAKILAGWLQLVVSTGLLGLHVINFKVNQICRTDLFCACSEINWQASDSKPN
jgi:hypothetical protein